MAATFPGIDRDVAVTGALLHDIGKIEAYEQTGGAIELSDAGKLQGEIPLGYYRVRREIEAIDGLPRPTPPQAVLHIVLSHHGKLEHGSPVDPVHARGHAGAHDRQPRRHARQLRPAREGRSPTAPAWSGFDRALSGSAYFGARERADGSRKPPKPRK